MAMAPIVVAAENYPEGDFEEGGEDVTVPFGGMEEMVGSPVGGAIVTEEDDGGVLIEFGEDELEEIASAPHDANLAEYLDDTERSRIAAELVALYDADKRSRKDWDERLAEGMKLVGMSTECRSEPFKGASAVTHPLVAEAVTQFQAQAYKELLPAAGPVRTMILGKKTPEKEAQAVRVKEFMNYQIIDRMPGYDEGMDQLLWYVGLAGSGFKKVYPHGVYTRAVSEFVPALDLVLPYHASSLETSPRATHVLRMTYNEIKKYQARGIYLPDVVLSPSDGDNTAIRDQIDRIQGTSNPGAEVEDDEYVLLEMHVDLDIEGLEHVGEDGEPTGVALPYIVTFDQDSLEVLSIRRNFPPVQSPTDIPERLEYFVHYRFMPGPGIYGQGMLHLLGGLGQAATGILRQLIDSGTLSNLPSGFKAKGVRLTKNDEPLSPGEYRDIDVPGGDLKNALLPLPFKQPSQTLASLLGALVESGRRYVSLADDQMANMNQEAPVGTTLAILERGTKVLSAVHKRLHAAQKKELRLLARVFGDVLPPEYPYEVPGAEKTIFSSDFDLTVVDVIPVSDPNTFSIAQRLTLAQTQLQVAQTNPQLHNLSAAYRRVYQAMGVEDIEELLPSPPKPAPADPAVENARALGGSILQAFPDQDHLTHMKMHAGFLKLPIVSTSPPVVGAITAHLMEHVSLYARVLVTRQIESLKNQVMSMDQEAAEPWVRQLEADMQAEDPADLEQLVALQILEIQTKLLSELMPPSPDPMSDPLVQIRLKEVAVKEQDHQRKVAEGQTDAQLEAARILAASKQTDKRIQAQRDIARDRNVVNRERIDVQKEGLEVQREAIDAYD